MKYGNASWGFRETPLEEQLSITKKMGLPILELGIANAPNDIPLEVSDSELAEVKKLFSKYGVELCCAATGNDFTNGNREDLEKVKRVMDICEKLGVRILRVFAGFSPAEEVTGEKWNCMIECLKEAAEYNQNVTLAVETHGGVNAFDDGVEHFYSTSTKPEILYRMLSELPENIKITYDPANLWAVGLKKPEEIYREIKDRVVVAHLKDFVTLSSGHLKPAACGESEMDWKAILEELSSDIPCLFEYENTEDVEQGLKRCLDFIKKQKDF